MKNLAKALVAMSITLLTAAPAAMAQVVQPPEGRVDFTMQGHSDGVTNWRLKGLEKQCAIARRRGVHSYACDELAIAHASGEIGQLRARAVRRAVYNGEVPGMLPSIIPGSHGSMGHFGGLGRMFGGSWYQSLGNGFWCKEGPGENCYGKYDEAALWGTVMREGGDIFSDYMGHRRANKQMDQNYDLATRELDMRQDELDWQREQAARRQQQQRRQPQPVVVQQTQVPAQQTHVSNGTVIRNRTGYDVKVFERGQAPVLLISDGLITVLETKDIEFRLVGGDCDIEPYKDAAPDVDTVIVCAN